MTRTGGEPGASPYVLYGVEASPYTVKLRAALRYRRLPYRWMCRFVQMYEPLAHVRPQLMPVLQFPDGELRTDSTPILDELDERHGPGRSLLPERPRDRFLARLIEDMADEWLTKCLYHYRFGTMEDAEFAARWVMDDARGDLSAADPRRGRSAFRGAPDRAQGAGRLPAGSRSRSSRRAICACSMRWKARSPTGASCSARARRSPTLRCSVS